MLAIVAVAIFFLSLLPLSLLEWVAELFTDEDAW